MSRAVTVLVTYRPRAGAERRFFTLLRRHWPTLREAGLVAPMAPRLWRAADKRTGRRYFVEIFAWKDTRASDSAHHHPAVMAVWGPMEPLLESMEIATVEEVAVSVTLPAGPRRSRRQR